MITPYMFWKRFDRLKSESLKDICARQGIRYDRLLHNRSDCRLPKAEDLVALGDAVGVSIEYLLTGRHHYSARIRRIADHLTDQGCLRGRRERRDRDAIQFVTLPGLSFPRFSAILV